MFNKSNILIIGALIISGLIIFSVFYFIEKYNLAVFKKASSADSVYNRGIGVEPPKNIVNISPPFFNIATSTKLKIDKLIKSFPIISFENLNSGLLILKEERTPTENNHYENAFFFSIFNTKTETEQKIGFVSTEPWIAKPRLEGDKIYFINKKGKINYFDIKTKNTNQLEFSENSNINDFYVSGNLVFYLRNGCSERMSCVLGVYNNKSKQNKIIVDKIETSPVGIVTVVDYMPDKNSLLLIYSMGDAGVAAARLTKINLETGKEESLYGVSFEYCGEYANACTDIQKKKNYAYNTFKEKYLDKINSCDNVTIKSGNGRDGKYLSIGAEKGEITLKRAWFIGCFKK